MRQNILNGNKGGWGVHLYADADDNLIEHNIIDGNRGGVIFAGDGNTTSDNNEVRNNAITNSGPRWNIEGSWSGGPRGTGNTAHHNCLYTTGPDGPDGIEPSEGGFTPTANTAVTANPYINRTTGDLRFRTRSACDRLVGAVAGASVHTPAAPPSAWAPAATGFGRADCKEGRFPTRAELDEAAPKHPVLYHAGPGGHGQHAWRLKVSGSPRTRRTRANGVVVKDPDTGEPTGMLRNAYGVLKGVPGERRATAERSPRGRQEAVRALQRARHHQHRRPQRRPRRRSTSTTTCTRTAS